MSPTCHDGYHTLIWDNRIFKAGTKFSKERSFYTSYVPLHGSFFQQLETKDALARRNLFSTYFSQRSVRRAEPLILNLSSKFLDLLQAAASDDEGKIVNLSKGFRCLTSDVIMNFTFHKPLGALESLEFGFPMTRALSEAVKYGQWVAYFPSSFRMLFRWIDKLPLWFLDKYMEPLALTKWCMRVRSLRSTLLFQSNDVGQGSPRTHTRIESSAYQIIRPPPYHFRHCTQTWCGQRTNQAYYRWARSRYATPTDRRHRQYRSRAHFRDIQRPARPQHTEETASGTAECNAEERYIARMGRVGKAPVSARHH